MPRIGWSVEQRAGVRRWMQFSTAFFVLGVILSIVLIVIGNTGGWGLLVLISCIYGAAFMYIRNVKGEQPD